MPMAHGEMTRGTPQIPSVPSRNMPKRGTHRDNPPRDKMGCVKREEGAKGHDREDQHDLIIAVALETCTEHHDGQDQSPIEVWQES